MTTEKEIAKCYNKLKNSQVISKIDTRVKPSDIVRTSCLKLKLSFEVTRAAMRTADNFGVHGICEGKKPKTIAGVAIYMTVMRMKMRFDSE